MVLPDAGFTLTKSEAILAKGGTLELGARKSLELLSTALTKAAVLGIAEIDIAVVVARAALFDGAKQTEIKAMQTPHLMSAAIMDFGIRLNQCILYATLAMIAKSWNRN